MKHAEVAHLQEAVSDGEAGAVGGRFLVHPHDSESGFEEGAPALFDGGCGELDAPPSRGDRRRDRRRRPGPVRARAIPARPACSRALAPGAWPGWSWGETRKGACSEGRLGGHAGAGQEGALGIGDAHGASERGDRGLRTSRALRLRRGRRLQTWNPSRRHCPRRYGRVVRPGRASPGTRRGLAAPRNRRGRFRARRQGEARPRFENHSPG